MAEDMIERAARAIGEQVDARCVADAAGIVPIDLRWTTIARAALLAALDPEDEALAGLIDARIDEALQYRDPGPITWIDIAAIRRATIVAMREMAQGER